MIWLAGFWNGNNAPAGQPFAAHMLSDVLRCVVVAAALYGILFCAWAARHRSRADLWSSVLAYVLLMLGCGTALVTEITRFGAPPTYRLVLLNLPLTLGVILQSWLLVNETRAGRWTNQIMAER